MESGRRSRVSSMAGEHKKLADDAADRVQTETLWSMLRPLVTDGKGGGHAHDALAAGDGYEGDREGTA